MAGMSDSVADRKCSCGTIDQWSADSTIVPRKRGDGV